MSNGMASLSVTGLTSTTKGIYDWWNSAMLGCKVSVCVPAGYVFLIGKQQVINWNLIFITLC